MKILFCGHSRRCLPTTRPCGSCRGVPFLSILGILLLFPLAGRLQAQNRFQTGSGSWHTPGLWSTGAVPLSHEEVRIGGSTLWTATISSGDAVSGKANIADSDGDAGTVVVENARSWNLSGDLYVGSGGTGGLLVQGGGRVFNTNGIIAGFQTSVSTVTVTGTDSLWQNNSSLAVGANGNGTLNVGNGGKVTASSADVGASTSGEGLVTVSGTDSLLEVTGTMNVGRFGHGTVTIEAGGKVRTGTGNSVAYLGFYNDTSGTVTVTGEGSLWQTSGYLWVGYLGEGVFNVADGGKVTALSLSIRPSGSGKGTLNLAGTAGHRGVVETGSVSGASGGQVEFDGGILRATGDHAAFLALDGGRALIRDGGAFIDTGSFEVSIATVLENADGQTGSLTKQGTGRLTLTGVNTYSGDTTVGEGTLRVNGALAGGVMIHDEAALEGTGSVGTVTVESGGTLAPGESAGTLETGSQTWMGGGIYRWEVNAATGTAGTDWDLLDVNGMLTLASTVEDPFVLAVKGNLVGLDTGAEYAWTLLSADAGFDAAFDPNAIVIDLAMFTGKPAGMAFSLVVGEKDLVLKLAAVPEPGQVALIFTGLAVAAFLSRRRKSLPA